MSRRKEFRIILSTHPIGEYTVCAHSEYVRDSSGVI